MRQVAVINRHSTRFWSSAILPPPAHLLCCLFPSLRITNLLGWLPGRAGAKFRFASSYVMHRAVCAKAQSAMRRPSRNAHEDRSAIFIRVIVPASPQLSSHCLLVLVARLVLPPGQPQVPCLLLPSPPPRCNPLSGASHYPALQEGSTPPQPSTAVWFLAH